MRVLTLHVPWPLILAACLLPAAVTAQETTGNIEGRVVDQRGAPLEQAHLLVSGPALQGKRVAWTDDQGYFRVPALPVGLYAVSVSAMTYQSVTLENVRVQLGATTTLGNIRMDITAHEVEGTTIVAARPLIDPVSTSAGGNLTSETYKALPSDRDYQSIVTLVPGANASSFGDRANLSGTTGPETAYYVDGVNVVQPPSNAQSISLPHNFLREVEVREGGYEAEYGGVLGGIVNAVTASGGNEFHGQVFGFYANRLLTSGAKRGAAQTSSGFFAYDMGASAGGPLLKDRLWYFLAGNPTEEHEKVAVPGFGDRIDRQRAQRYSAKITWQAAEGTHVVFTALGDPTVRDQVGGIIRENGVGGLSQASALGNLDPYQGELKKGGTNFSLSTVHIMSPKGFVEATLSRADARSSLLPATARGRDEPLYIDTRTGFVEGGFGTLSDRKSGRTGARLAASYAWRRHSFKAGAEYSDEFYRTLEDQSAGDLGIVLRIGDSLYQTTTYADKRTSNHNRIPTGFVQDSWQLADGLRLNAGLRWSAEYWISSRGDVGQRITDEWQPRVGLIYLPGERGRQKLFASFGRAYQPTRLNTPQLFLQDVPNLFRIRIFDHDPRQDPTGGTTVFSQLLGRQAEVKDLEGAHHDEFQLGYEHLVLDQIKVGIRGRYRALRQGIVGVISPATGQAVYGNPGKGELSAYPEMNREYRALELVIQRTLVDATSLEASWVWSRNQGNYEGYWDQSIGANDPVGAAAFMASPALARNTDGPLPNDQTHVFKLFGSQSFRHGISAGTTFTWATGTPLSELGASPFGYPYFVFLGPRGRTGRTPSTYDLNLRLSWSVPIGRGGERNLRVIADAYHIGNPRRAVFVDQIHYRAVTGSGVQVSPNPDYGKALAFQPPAAGRLGMEMGW
jgi:hypothetical protein